MKKWEFTVFPKLIFMADTKEEAIRAAKRVRFPVMKVKWGSPVSIQGEKSAAMEWDLACVREIPADEPDPEQGYVYEQVLEKSGEDPEADGGEGGEGPGDGSGVPN